MKLTGINQTWGGRWEAVGTEDERKGKITFKFSVCAKDRNNRAHH